MPPRFAPHIQGTLLRMATFPAWLTPTGLSPSPAPAFQPDFGFTRQGTYVAILQHHIPPVSLQRVRFVLCRFRSPLLTASLLLSFPPPTKMFQFGGFPLLTE